MTDDSPLKEAVGDGVPLLLDLAFDSAVLHVLQAEVLALADLTGSVS
jgi:hypothetical protein